MTVSVSVWVVIIGTGGGLSPVDSGFTLWGFVELFRTASCSNSWEREISPVLSFSTKPVMSADLCFVASINAQDVLI